MILGRVIAATSAVPAPAASVSYTVRWQEPGGGYVQQSGVRPFPNRRQGTPTVEVVPFAVGTVVLVVVADGDKHKRREFHFVSSLEPEAVEGCP